MTRSRLIMLALAALLAPSSASVRRLAGAPPATISAVSWMAGHWVGRQGQVVFEDRAPAQQ